MQFCAENERVKRRYFDFRREADQCSLDTIENHRKAILRYEHMTGCADFKTFSTKLAVDFKNLIREEVSKVTGRPLRASTKLNTIICVRDFFRWLSDQPGYKSRIRRTDINYFNLDGNECNAAQSQSHRLYPTIEQYERAVASLPAGTEEEIRNRALMAFIGITGIRVRSVISLRLKHVNLEQGFVILDANEVKTKFGRNSIVFFFSVSRMLRQIFDEWYLFLRQEKCFGNDDPVFPGLKKVVEDKAFKTIGVHPSFLTKTDFINKIFRQGLGNAGLPYFTPHSARDMLANIGQTICETAKELRAWSQNLSHKNVMMTMTAYARLDSVEQGRVLNSVGRKEKGMDTILKALSDLKEQMKNQNEP